MPVKVLLMYRPDEAHLHNLRRAAPEAEIAVAESQESAAELIARADAVLGNRWFLQSLPHARRLRWMQSNSMGMDLILSAGEALKNVTVTRVREVYDDEVAEHAVALALALVRGLHLARDAQRDAAWRREPLRTIHGMRSLVLGWGGAGRGIGRRLLALGAEVAAVRRSHAGLAERNAGGVTVHGGGWRDALPHTDLLVLALPLTSATRNLVGGPEIAALPRGAYLVNVGRGETLDEAALLTAIQTAHLAGAGLDVACQEPLPAEHPLWRESRVLLTPHVGRSPETGRRRFEPVFEENLRRFASGEPLLYVVDRTAGF